MIMTVTITLYIENKEWVDEDQAISELETMDDSELWEVSHAINYKYKEVT